MGGRGSRRPEPFIQLGFPVAATDLAKANVLLNIQPHFFSAGDHVGDMFTTQRHTAAGIKDTTVEIDIVRMLSLIHI